MDTDWYASQAKPWEEVKRLASIHNVPILVAGDLFDKWNPPPELINFAIRTIPKIIAVPGQHDLPYHRYEDIKRSAYWTLVECGIVRDLKPGKMEPVSDHFAVMGFPWGAELKPWVMGQPIQGFNIALVHANCWRKDCTYPGAEKEAYYKERRKQLAGYRVAVIGDNHRDFLVDDGKTAIANCGGFMRRHTSDVSHAPGCYLIWSTGEVTRHYFDLKGDNLLVREAVAEEIARTVGGFDEFLEMVRSLGNSTVDYLEALQRWQIQNGVDEQVVDLINQFLEKPK